MVRAAGEVFVGDGLVPGEEVDVGGEVFCVDVVSGGELVAV